VLLNWFCNYPSYISIIYVLCKYMFLYSYLLMREALILLNLLASHTVFSKPTLEVLAVSSASFPAIMLIKISWFVGTSSGTRVLLGDDTSSYYAMQWEICYVS
jgi:hypothetical protein